MSMRYPGGLIATSPVNARYPSGVWTQAQAAPYQAQNVWTRDQFWPNTTLLLQGDGAVNGAQNNTFLDSSSNNFTITRNGSTTQGSFTPYEANGYWSNYFDGSGDYLTLTGSSIGSNNYTVEAWIFPNVMTTFAIFSLGTSDTTGSMVFWVNSNGAINLYGDNTDRVNSATNRIVAGQWQHVALVRNSGTTTIYVNGSSVASSSSAYTSTNTTYQICAGYGGLNTPITGYVSNLRVVNGTAVYTSNFTPSTTPLSAITNTALLTCQSNRFVDNSGSNRAITSVGNTSVQSFQPFPGATTYSSTLLGGSAFFPNVLTTGSVAYSNFLTLTNAAVNLSGASYTMEAWVCPNQYPSGTPPQELISVFEWYAAFDNRWGLGISSNAVYVYTDGPSAAISASFVVPLNAWTHLAASWDGTTTRLFANGTLIASNSTNYARNLSTLNIGRSRYSQYGITDLGAFPGYMADMRIVRGSAVYTASFTPPTAPITAVTNTQLLLSCTNAGIYDNSMMNDLETVGNAQVSTSVVKYGTGSMFFNGSGSYLTAPTSPNTGLSTGDFTIEAWVYCTSLSATQTINDARTGNTASAYVFAVFSSGALNFYDGPNNTDRTSSSGVVTINNWAHVAATRSGTTLRLFVNGVIVGTFTGISSDFGSNQPTQIGRQVSGSGIFNGYIDDLRITKGAARYITNFTPPPARMPGQ